MSQMSRPHCSLHVLPSRDSRQTASGKSCTALQQVQQLSRGTPLTTRWIVQTGQLPPTAEAIVLWPTGFAVHATGLALCLTSRAICCCLLSTRHKLPCSMRPANIAPAKTCCLS